MKPRVTIHTDGSASNLLGDGGYGAILVFGEGEEEKRKEISGALTETTSQRAEVEAALYALRALKRPCKVTIYSDSKYLIRGALFIGMRAPRSNGDLWEALGEAMEPHDVTFEKVKGHSGDELNERAHELAYAAYREVSEIRQVKDTHGTVPEWMLDETDGGGAAGAEVIDFAAAREKIKAATPSLSGAESPERVPEREAGVPVADYVIRIAGEVPGKGGNWKSPLLLNVSERYARHRYEHFASRNTHLNVILVNVLSGEVLIDPKGEERESENAPAI